MSVRRWLKYMLIVAVCLIGIISAAYVYLFHLGGVESIISSKITSLTDQKYRLDVRVGKVRGSFLSDIVVEDIEKELANPTEMRIFVIEKAFEAGIPIDRIFDLTRIDKWFLYKLKLIYDLKEKLEAYPSFDKVPDEVLLDAKKKGFSDFQITRLVLKCSSDEMDDASYEFRKYRKS